MMRSFHKALTEEGLFGLWKRTGKGLRGEKGITGLETAIILIAFVVVASVFAYTVLSAGLFASQKQGFDIHGISLRRRNERRAIDRKYSSNGW